MGTARGLQALIGAAAAATLCVGALLIDSSESRKFEALQREHVRASLSRVRSRLEMAINERVHVAHGLEALALLRPDITQPEFAAFASAFEHGDGVAQVLQLARAGVVSHVYPEHDGRAVIGHSLLSDPAVSASARQALETRQMRVAGPYELRQGGRGLVARLPIFRRGDGAFWGFATVLIDFPSLLQASGIAELGDVALAMRGRDGLGERGDVFYGDRALFGAESLTTEVRLPNGRWILAAQPANGWSAQWPGRPVLWIVTALLLAAIPLVSLLLRRKARAHAATEQLRLRDRLLMGLGEGVYGADADGRCTFINPAALRLLGWERDEVLGGPASTLLDPREAARLDGDGAPREASMRRKDGTLFPAHVVVAPIDEGGGTVVAFDDLTVRKQAEERLRLAASVFAHAQQGIMVTDLQGRLVDVNPAFTDITGYAREEVLGRNPRLLSSGRQTPEFYDEMKRSLERTGSWRGEIWNRHKSGQAYPEMLSIAAVHGSDGRPTHYIGVFSDISRQKQHEDELARIAHYDGLTGLPNRVLLRDRLTQGIAAARLTRGRIALGMLDLDRFKDVNDRFGHEAGDEVLIEVSRRLQSLVRPSDTVARLGGDEFAILFSATGGVAACEAHAHRVVEALAAPFAHAGHAIPLSASLGFTLFPDDTSDADTLLRHADQAMYLAKESGGRRYRLFDPEQDRQARLRREGLDRIARALAAGEMRLFYQPKVDMRQGRIVGLEALVRWQHPTEGLLRPAAFLPMVASTELDPALGRWVLRECVRQMAAWREAGLPIAVSVNVSAAHLLEPGFLDELDAVLREHPGVDARSLEVEILETAAFDDLGTATVVLDGCLARGVGVAIDDFGTGYSSLAYFKRLPARTLKIDQLFIRDMLCNPEDRAMVESIIRFARAFNRDIVAEGVENAALCRALLAMGCPVAQGYEIAPPMPAASVADWVRDFRPSPAWFEGERLSA